MATLLGRWRQEGGGRVVVGCWRGAKTCLMIQVRAFVRRLMVLAGLFAWGLLEVIALGLVGIAVGSLALVLLDGKPVSEVRQYI
jgi:hypothetical protein